MIKLVKDYKETGLFDDLDLLFADFIGRIETNDFSSNEFEVLLKSAALISRQISCGHICLSEKDIIYLKSENDVLNDFLPLWADIVEVVSKSSSCSNSDKNTPIIFDGKRLYLYRYWLYENRLAKHIIEISQKESRYSDKLDKIKNSLIVLFKEEGVNNGQIEASFSAVKNRFSVITGGPGTGKTTALAKIIASVLTCFPDERVILAAPTGKAASRMNEALKNALMSAGDLISEEVRQKIQNLNGSSIHRLLGWTSSPGVFKHNKENQLDAGFVIIDEASMIDLSLMSKLVDAVKKDSSLILLGDKDQLTSVEAGNVLGDICIAASKGIFKNKPVSVLTKSYRFEKSPFIGRLSAAINNGADFKSVSNIFQNCNDNSIELINKKISSSMETVKNAIIDNYSFLFDQKNPEEMLGLLEKFRILCASKIDKGGVEEINRFAVDIFSGMNLIKKSGDLWYHGRPVMVTENNYSLELFNGDCGVILEKNNEKRGYFSSNDGSLRSFPVAILPKTETVYAMTVHKSQGSEYDSVMIILPEKDMPVTTKELIYTAITRAKKSLTIISDDIVLEKGMQKSAARNSGLTDALIFLSKQSI